MDLQSGTVRVRRAQCEVYDPNAKKYKKIRIELGEPKTRANRRTIRVSPKVVEALKAHREALGHNRVFVAPDGQSLRRSNFIRREWKPLLEEAKLPDVGFNVLRHTTATDSLLKGLHGKVVQTRLGHAQISTTIDTYSDALPKLDAHAAELLAEEPAAEETKAG